MVVMEKVGFERKGVELHLKRQTLSRWAFLLTAVFKVNLGW